MSLVLGLLGVVGAIAPIAGRDAIEVRGETALGSVINRTERGQVVAIEVLDASERLQSPPLLELIGARVSFSSYRKEEPTLLNNESKR